MLTFFALAAAVAALVVAFQTRRELHELRIILARQEWNSGPRPVAEPAPAVAAAEAAAATEPSAGGPISSSAIETGAPPPPPGSWSAAPTPPEASVPAPVPAAARAGIDWERLVGINLFSWIAGIALVLAAVFLFKYSVDHGWLRPAVRATFGLAGGIALLVVCELRIARNYKLTANAMLGAGIAILYATLFALHGRWHLWPAAAAFAGMAVVTAAAVYLSTRRDSVFIALLGLLGGFATPALLSSGENQPVALFSYLLLLNGGIAWIAWRKQWPVLTAISVVLTAFYQWTWVDRFLTTGQLPLAAAIFLLFAVVGASSLLRAFDDSRRDAFRRTAAFAAALPLLFAFFTAVVPEYGAEFHVLFGFLLLLTLGLTAIAFWRGPSWLHSLGAAATLVTFFIWLVVSYTPASWPWSLVWLAAFVALHLAAQLRIASVAVYAAPLLFFVFAGLAIHEPGRHATLTGTMLALLAIVVVFAFSRALPYVGAIALALSSVTLMLLERQPANVSIATQLVLFATLLLLAASSRRLWLPVAALPFLAAALIASSRYDAFAQFIAGVTLYALFMAWPLVLGKRARRSAAPYLAACGASLIFFVQAYLLRDELGYGSYIGALPITLSILLLTLVPQLLRFATGTSRLLLVSGVALAFLSAAVPLQLEKEWITIAWAIEAAALAWLFTRIPHRGLLVWTGGLATIVLIRLALNPAVYDYHPREAQPILNWYLYTYLLCAAAAFVAARLAPPLRALLVTAGTIELFVLLNIEIADFYARTDALTFNFTSASLAQDLTYTMGWAAFAIAMLVTGISFGSRGARVAALALLLVTIFKCFLHDLARLGGLYRVGSLLGLAVALVIVGVMLQKFVVMRRDSTAA